MSRQTITEFLEARIAEDEMAAKAATPGPWIWRGQPDGQVLASVESLPEDKYGYREPVAYVVTAEGYDEPRVDVSESDAKHLVRHDPARVLAEGAAKRAILADVESVRLFNADYSLIAGHAERQLAHLAAVHSDHADYQQEWAL
jgi:hypothetical protein